MNNKKALRRQLSFLNAFFTLFDEKKVVCYIYLTNVRKGGFMMSTLAQLKEVALRHFAMHGYDGASLANIAAEVGIKKQSIYTYFKGKDALFLQIYKDAYAFEMQHVVSGLEHTKNETLHDMLYTFLAQSIERFATFDSTKFLLRNAFLPPTHLHEQVLQEVYHYLDALELLFVPIFEQKKTAGEMNAAVDTNIAATAFLALLDGLYVEMLYGDEVRLQKRFTACWTIFWQSVRQESGGNQYE